MSIRNSSGGIKRDNGDCARRLPGARDCSDRLFRDGFFHLRQADFTDQFCKTFDPLSTKASPGTGAVLLWMCDWRIAVQPAERGEFLKLVEPEREIYENFLSSG